MLGETRCCDRVLSPVATTYLSIQKTYAFCRPYISKQKQCRPIQGSFLQTKVKFSRLRCILVGKFSWVKELKQDFETSLYSHSFLTSWSTKELLPNLPKKGKTKNQLFSISENSRIQINSNYKVKLKIILNLKVIYFTNVG